MSRAIKEGFDAITEGFDDLKRKALSESAKGGDEPQVWCACHCMRARMRAGAADTMHVLVANVDMLQATMEARLLRIKKLAST